MLSCLLPSLTILCITFDPENTHLPIPWRSCVSREACFDKLFGIICSGTIHERSFGGSDAACISFVIKASHSTQEESAMGNIYFLVNENPVHKPGYH